MKRILTSLLLAFFAVVGFAQQDVDNGYVIRDWTYDAVVHKDNSWTVTERFDVEFLEARHGIFRSFPTVFVQYREVDGKKQKYNYVITYENIRVPGESYELTKNDDQQHDLILRLGSESVTLNGPHTYTMEYTLRYPDDRITDYDEVVHTVLGHACNTTVDRFDFRIEFEKKLPKNFADNLQVYSGKWGSQENSVGVECHVEGNCIVGSARNIKPYKAITIAAPLPEGFWIDPPAVSPNLSYLLLGVAGVLLLFIIVYLITHQRHRPTVVYEYAPPAGISSAEVGTIIDDSADLGDLTSLIIWWGSRGYLKIVEHSARWRRNDIELIKLRDLPDDAPAYQKQFWSVFFKGDSALIGQPQRVLLSSLGDKHEAISSALAALSRHFADERKLVKTDTKTVLLFTAYVVVAALAMGMSSSIEPFHMPTMVLAGAFWALPVYIVAMVRLSTSGKDLITSTVRRLLRYVVFGVLAVANVALFANYGYNAPDMYWPLAIYAVIIASGWGIAAFAGRFKEDTPYRREMMGRLLGFREFIEKSELPMLKSQVDENPHFFFDILPFAIVFGLSDKWCKQFEKLGIVPPDWYETDRLNNGIPPYMVGNALASNLARNFNHEISRAVAKSSVDPSAHSSSGGGGGGGFSGGGGGGGGVGSW